MICQVLRAQEDKEIPRVREKRKNPDGVGVGFFREAI